MIDISKEDYNLVIKRQLDRLALVFEKYLEGSRLEFSKLTTSLEIDFRDKYPDGNINMILPGLLLFAYQVLGCNEIIVISNQRVIGSIKMESEYDKS